MNKSRPNLRVFFWVLFALFSVASFWFAGRFFSTAMPSVDVELSVDRQHALDRAAVLSRELALDPQDARQVAYFSTDHILQSFIELKEGGKAVFSRLIAEGTITPYQWQVRRFAEGSASEATFYFHPNGQALGFNAYVPESVAGPSLGQKAARAIAEKNAADLWCVDFCDFELVETKTHVQVSGRTDFTFVYQNISTSVYDAPLRMKLGVSGDKFTSIIHYVQVPDAFVRTFREMRSANHYVALAGTVTFYILYVFGGCILGLAFLYRKKWLIWKQALILAGIVATLKLLADIGAFDQVFLSYDTALSSRTFVSQQIFNIFISTLGTMGYAFVGIMTAEGLTRWAFPGHLQLWKLFSVGANNTLYLWKRVVIGYLFVGIFLAYVVLTYWIAYQYFGWWSPSSTIFDPNILASRVPWLQPLSQAFHAGLLEECLFRAVPLSLAALIGQKINKRKTLIVLALVLQALVFGAMHANYPTQPSYARLVELIIPALVFGWLYLSYGLLPGIICHVIYDLILMSSPIFLEKSSSSWIGKVVIVTLALSPLVLLLYRRLKQRGFDSLNLELLNKNFRVKEVSRPFNVRQVKAVKYITTTTALLCFLSALAGFALWLTFSNFTVDNGPMSIDAGKARLIAADYIKGKNIVLEGYSELNSIHGEPGIADYYIWENSGKSGYRKLMGNFVNGPYYQVRYAKFEGALEAREEEFSVGVNTTGKVIWYSHKIPQTTKIASIEESVARKIAHQFLQTQGFVPKKLKEISAAKISLPHRHDWKFIFGEEVRAPYLGHEAARIELGIVGKSVEYFSSGIHVPEQWSREYTGKSGLASTFVSLCIAFLAAIFLIGGIRAMVLWSRGGFSHQAFVVSGVLILLLAGLNAINNEGTAIFTFNTFESFSAQYLVRLVLTGLKVLVFALVTAFIFGSAYDDFGQNHVRPRRFKVLTPFFLGLFMAGFLVFIGSSFGPSYPQWGNYHAFVTHYPMLQYFIAPALRLLVEIAGLLIVVLFANAVSENFERRKMLTIMFFILFGVATIGARGITDLGDWLLPGIAYGFVLLLVYILVLRFDLSLVPMFVLPSVILSSLHEGLLVEASSLQIAVACSLAFNVLWCALLQRHLLLRSDRLS